MTERFCEPVFGIPYWHRWYSNRPTGPAPFPFSFSLLEKCPAHDGLPFHNGPDDRFAQEDE